MNTLFTGPLTSVSHHNQVVVLRYKDPMTGWRTRPIHELIMIRGAKGYSWLYWHDGSRQIAAYTLKHYELRLPMSQYIRVHQNCMVNREFIQKVQLTHKGPQLNLSTGDKVSISRRRWLSVKRLMKSHDET